MVNRAASPKKSPSFRVEMIMCDSSPASLAAFSVGAYTSIWYWWLVVAVAIKMMVLA